MGRPLYSSTLLARQASAAKETTELSQQPQAPVPVVEKWSRWNAFDPDSDEFFQAEDAVYEAFLTEEQIAEGERLARDERARLAAARMIREGASGTPATVGTEAPTDVVSEAIARSGPASGIELYFMGSPPPGAVRVGERQNPLAEASSPPVPRINVTLTDSLQMEGMRSPSPDPLNLVSGLPHLSESPRPMEPQDLPSGAASPVPDTPARVSGIFNTAPPQRSVESPQGTSHTAHHLTFYDQLRTRPWTTTRSPGNGRRYRIPSVPAPLIS